jgi:quercetin dioxygenase-like cupin family protein|tara:strand:- start:289 stop:888 length:600 start_codon:yes stop_codon:yes gene_type:complete
MISEFISDPLNEHKNSISVTYPRTVDIIYGSYSYPEIIHYFLLQIKNNIDNSMRGYTNVKGGMTKWEHFVGDEKFSNFITYLVNKYQTSHPDVFQHFLQTHVIDQAWGTETKKGDSLKIHTHPCVHGVLYLTEGCDLILPELNIKIKPKPGDYYILPPFVYHGFEQSKQEQNRYSLVFNIQRINDHDYYNNLEKLNANR